MHIGLGLTLQRLDGKPTDAEVYRTELALGVRAEEAGFDSVWFSEHHFSDYQLTSQSPMVLSWLAGQTTRVKLGQMVTVLPVARPGAGGRELSRCSTTSPAVGPSSGSGRGLGRIEFNSFRVEMGESCRRFTEYSEAILEALETGYIEHDGELYKQPRVAIRPRPLPASRAAPSRRPSRRSRWS